VQEDARVEVARPISVICACNLQTNTTTITISYQYHHYYKNGLFSSETGPPPPFLKENLLKVFYGPDVLAVSVKAPKGT